MKKGLMLIFIFILILSTGCMEQSTEKIDTMEKRIADLEQQVSDQSLKTTILEEMITEQVFKVYMLEEGASKRAVLDPTDNSGYSVSGDFLILISDAEEYLDGCKVYLKIGNPNNAIYKGYTIKARYGPRANFSDENFDYVEWEESLKEKEIKISTNLEKGAWSNTEIILPSINVKDFSHLDLEIITNTISLFDN